MIDKKWFAVYTKVRWEKKVAELLTKKKIENYCPLTKVEKQWADRTKVIYERLFTSYVFVKITSGEQVQMLNTEGIINFVFWLGKPAVIKDQEIDTIQTFLQNYPQITLQQAS